MKAYKGFGKNMRCNGYQFAEGETYEHEGDVKLCKSGFHACEDPVDCLRYYDPCTSVYHEVEIDGVSAEREDDTKIVGKKIKIGARIGIKEMVKASVDLTFAACKGAENADSASGDYSRQAASGNESRQAASGHSSRQSASGNNSIQSASGNNSIQAASGEYSRQAASWDISRQAASGNNSIQAASGGWSIQAASGNNSIQAASGNNSIQAASGRESRQATSGRESSQVASGGLSIQAASGNNSRQAASGDWSRQETTGKNCVMMSAGDGGRARGKVGSWIVLTEWVDGVPDVVAKRIDGVKIKEDTWYTLKGKKLVEVDF